MIDFLERRLAGQLPGKEAQRQMMPFERMEERFNPELLQNARPSGVLVAFYQKDDEWCIPLTQRHDYSGPHSGQVSFPGGKMEEEDNTIRLTALREAQEEVGILPNDVRIVGQLSDLYIPPSNFRVTPVVGVLEHPPEFALNDFEVKELIEVPLSLLQDKETVKRKDIKIQNGFMSNVPYFDVYGKVVWGATAMMLSELLSIIKDWE